MSISCTTSPTATSTILVTTPVTTTGLVESIITSDPTTSAIATTTTCLGFVTPSAGTPTCTSSSAITQFTIIPGGVTTTQIPTTITTNAVSTILTTLFGTSCTTIPSGNGNGNNNGNNGNNGNSGGGSQSGNGNGSGIGTGSGNGNRNDTVITPPPTVITTPIATTLPNGEVQTVIVTLTSTLPPITSSSDSSDSSPPISQTQTPSENSKDKVDMAPAIGGALGGFFALLFIALAIWLFIIKRRRRWDDIFDKSLNDPDGVGSMGYHTPSGSHSHSNSGRSKARFSLGPDLEVEPKPYQYGIVGHPSSPTTQQTTGSPNGKDMATITSRPSTAGSNYPLLGGSGHHNAPSNGSSHVHTPAAYSPTATPTVLTSFPTSTPPQPSTTQNEIEGYFGRRAGSPVSFVEGPRKLQVINGSPPSIYGGQSLHQRMMSDSPEPSTPIGTPRNLSSINFGTDFGQATGANPTKGGEMKERKPSLPAVGSGKSGVLTSEDGPPKLILNL